MLPVTLSTHVEYSTYAPSCTPTFWIWLCQRPVKRPLCQQLSVLSRPCQHVSCSSFSARTWLNSKRRALHNVCLFAYTLCAYQSGVLIGSTCSGPGWSRWEMTIALWRRLLGNVDSMSSFTTASSLSVQCTGSQYMPPLKGCLWTKWYSACFFM